MSDAARVVAAELVRPWAGHAAELDPLGVPATDGDLDALNAEGALVCPVMGKCEKWGMLGGPYTHLMFHPPTSTYWLVHLVETAVTG